MEGYDNANRLTSLDNKKSDAITILASYSFTLDGNGNRTQVIQDEPIVPILDTSNVNYTYNSKKNRLMTSGAFSFGYDDEGQLNTGYSSSYSFDYEHRLVTAGTTQYSYDGAGNRVQADRDGVTTRYIYDASGNLLAEADGNNVITKYYIHGLGLMAMVMPTNEVYTYHFNAVGSTITMTDQSQTIVNKYAYDPFGNVTMQETISQPFMFVGQHGVMIEPDGFYYMRARYYDPNVGRFISEDPIGFDGGINLFIYAINNPITFYDPNGLDPGGWPNPYPSHSRNRQNGDSPYQTNNSVLQCHVATHNDPGDTIKGVLAIAAVTLAPVAIDAAVSAATAASITVLGNPATSAKIQQVVSDFVLNATPGSPPPTNWTGLAGAATSRAIDIFSKQSGNK